MTHVDLTVLSRDQLLALYPHARTDERRRAIRRRLAELDDPTLPPPPPVRPSAIPQLPPGWAHDPAVVAELLVELGPDRPVTGEQCARAVDAVARRLAERARGVTT